MTIFTLVASHQLVDLSTVAHLADGAQVLSERLTPSPLKGLVVLSTCNRLEMYAEIPHTAGSTAETIQAEVNSTAERIFDDLATESGLDRETVSSSFEVLINENASHHLFTVASGLESAVVGEREITGQVRRAITAAQETDQATGNLVRLFDRAAHTARQVGQQTLLGSRGRSVVSVALDLADDVAEGDWASRRVLIFGTGAYAGATVAALKERGCTDIWVHSSSGRAATFADKRGISPISAENLKEEIGKADLVVGCSGSGSPLPASSIPSGKHVILDLALSRDFDPEVADLPGMELITLESVRLAAPAETNDSVALARTIVDTASAEFAVQEKARNIDAAIVALRKHTMSVLDTELEKMRKQHACSGAADQVELAMRRMVKSLLHTPTTRARALAKEGRADEYISGLEALYGIEVEPPVSQPVSEEQFRAADAS